MPKNTGHTPSSCAGTHSPARFWKEYQTFTRCSACVGAALVVPLSSVVTVVPADGSGLTASIVDQNTNTRPKA